VSKQFLQDTQQRNTTPLERGVETAVKRFLRKAQVAKRYGGISTRSVERGVEDGRIPPPEYPIGENTPLWDAHKLETVERIAVLRRNELDTNWRDRLISWIATSPRDQAATILHQYKDLIDALSDSAREKLLAELQDIVAEIPQETD
jgi:hypothetical protein